MRFSELIDKKRLNNELSTDEINYWIKGYVNGDIPDYQVSAMCMAICFNGMNDREIGDLTIAMRDSGDVIDLSKINGVKIDKHSTGGVGDKTSLTLIPLVAACGAKAAKMSGSGLGHTGGTLDKLSSIEGFDINVSDENFVKQVNEIGCAIIGQTTEIDPADKKLYALRDVTATIQSVPLIASSIMSKKLASGADTILLDVKYGSGAFMKTKEDAIELATTMINIGKYCGKDTRAMITSMEQPLGNAIGNALEVKEAIETLKGNGPKDFTLLCKNAARIILQQAKLANDDNEADSMIEEAINSGKAIKKLKEMVKYQHGNVDQIDNPDLLPSSKDRIEIKTDKEGYISSLDALKIGILAMQLGAGREKKGDPIDYSVGIVLNKKLGDYVSKGDILAFVHTNKPLETKWVEEFIETFIINKDKVEIEPLIYKVI